MKFIIDSNVFEKFPDLAVGVAVLSNINNSDNHIDIAEMLREEEKKITEKLDPEMSKEHPHIASLQEVHRSFGSNPNKYPPSIQALVKRILKGGQLPAISPLVDVYNLISLRYIICVGAEDIDACEGDIRLAYADGSESFALIGEEEEDPPLPGELVYKDDVGVICRKLNWREGNRTQTTDSTKNAIVVIEGFTPVSADDVQKALDDASKLLQQYCGATVRCEILTKDSTALQLS